MLAGRMVEGKITATSGLASFAGALLAGQTEWAGGPE
jgi:hypothetical protein